MMNSSNPMFVTSGYATDLMLCAVDREMKWPIVFHGRFFVSLVFAGAAWATAP